VPFIAPVGNLFAAEGAARPLAAAVDVAAGSPNVRLQEFVAVESDVLFVIVFDVCPLHKLIFFCGGGEQLPFLRLTGSGDKDFRSSSILVFALLTGIIPN